MARPIPRSRFVIAGVAMAVTAAGVFGITNATSVSASKTAAGELVLDCPPVASPVEGQQVTCTYRRQDTPPTKPPATRAPAHADNTGNRLASLQAASGDITKGGTAAAPLVISGKVYDSAVVIRASHVVVRDTVFNGGVCIVENSDVTLEWVSVKNGVCVASAWNTTVRNTEIYGGGDLVHVTSDRTVGGTRRMVRNTVLDTVWAHDPTAQLPSHVDGVQVRGVEGLTIQNSHFDLGTFQESENAAFFTENANGGNRDLRIKDTWLNGGGITLRYADTGGYFELTNVSIQKDYRWGAQYDPKQGSSPTRQSGNRLQRKDGSWTPLKFL